MYISNGLCAVIFASNCLNEPAAAFRAFANFGSPKTSRSSFNFSKSSFPINTSPRTVIFNGSVNFLGIDFILFTFSVISSPTTPSPRVLHSNLFAFLFVLFFYQIHIILHKKIHLANLKVELHELLFQNRFWPFLLLFV